MVVAQSTSDNQVRISRHDVAIADAQESIASLQTGVEQLGLNLDNLAHSLAVSNKQIDQKKGWDRNCECAGGIDLASIERVHGADPECGIL